MARPAGLEPATSWFVAVRPRTIEAVVVEENAYCHARLPRGPDNRRPRCSLVARALSDMAPCAPVLAHIWNMLAVGLATVLNLQVASASKHYVSPCQVFEFDYPANWVVAAEDRTDCHVKLRPQNYTERMKDYDVDLYTLDVGIEKGEFLTVAAEHFFDFDFAMGYWISVTTREPADVVHTQRWRGLNRTVSGNCYHESGGNAGLCEGPVLVLRDDDDRLWSMRATGPDLDDVWDMVLATFRFKEP